MTAFRHLSTCRQVGMGPGPIPWTAIVEYARMLQLGPEQSDALHYHIARMDSAYLEWSDRQVEVKTKKT